MRYFPTTLSGDTILMKHIIINKFGNNDGGDRNTIASICKTCRINCCMVYTIVHYPGAFFKFPEYLPEKQYTMYLNKIQRKTNRTNKCEYYKPK